MAEARIMEPITKEHIANDVERRSAFRVTYRGKYPGNVHLEMRVRSGEHQGKKTAVDYKWADFFPPGIEYEIGIARLIAAAYTAYADLLEYGEGGRV